MNNIIYHRNIHDAVHGSFFLHKLLWHIIDTPEFQRLKNIKQTGNVHQVYDCAYHTRFEHSVAVSYLCKVFLDTLRQRLQYESDDKFKNLISNKDILMLQLAGLCHDLDTVLLATYTIH